MDDVRITGEKPSVIVSDADVLIDYLDSDPEILGMISENIWEVWIPAPVYECTRQLNETTLKKLGLRIIDPEEIQLVEASRREGSPSTEDRLCYIVARDSNCDCWTNDKRLRKLCEDNGVNCHWGLAPMIRLVEMGVLSAERALRTAGIIHENNPFYIRKWIVEDFRRKVRLIKEVDDG